MNLLRYCILLFVVIGLVPIATADVPIHSFSGIHDETDDTLFVYVGDVKDTVIPQSQSSTMMSFLCYDPSDDFRQLSYKSINNNLYINVIDNTDEEGTWSVHSTEADSLVLMLMGYSAYPSDATFIVAQLPEFTFGSFISLIFSGALYFLMRRTVKGSVNVG